MCCKMIYGEHMQALEYWFHFGFKLRHRQLGVMSYWQIAGIQKGEASWRSWSLTFLPFCPISLSSWPWCSRLLINTEVVSHYLQQKSFSVFITLSIEDDKSSKCEMVFLWWCSHFVNCSSKTLLRNHGAHTNHCSELERCDSPKHAA